MGTVPIATSWASSEFVTPTIMNARIRDAIAFFLNPPMAVMRQNGAVQAITTGTFTAITFDVEDKDTDNGHSTVTNTSRFTAQTPGMYLVSGQFSAAINATGVRGCRLLKNAAVVPSSVQIVPPTPAATTPTVVAARTQLVSLGVGDFIEVQGFQSSGGSLNTSITGTEQQCGMTVLWAGTG